METTTKTKRGRKAVVIHWPDGQFTTKDVADSTKLSKVSIQLKITSAIGRQELVVVGKQKTSQIGRPYVVYTRTVSPSNALTSNA